MGNRGKQHGIMAAVPGAHSALRWYGWVGIGMLLLPATTLAMRVVANFGAGAPEWPNLYLPIASLLALAGSGVLCFLIVSGLRRMAELTILMCESGSAPVAVKDRDGRYTFVNEFAAALFGRLPKDVIGCRDRELQPGADALAHEENDRVCIERDLPTMFREQRAVPGDGLRSFLVNKYPLHDLRGRIAGLLGMFRDLTDAQEVQELGRRRAEEKRIWLELNPMPVVRFASGDLQILETNAAAERCYGYTRQQLARMRLPELFAVSEGERLQAALDGLPQVATVANVGWRQRRASGEIFDAFANLGSLAHDEVPTGIMMVRDVSADNATRRALRECNARYEDMVESGLAMVWVHDLSGRLLRVNGAMANALGFEREAMVGRSLSDFIAEDARATWDEYLDRVRSLRRDTGILHVASRAGERSVWQYSFVCYLDAQPTPFVLGIAQDVTLRRRHELKLRDQNQRDALTGLPTRRWLETFAMQATPGQAWGCVTLDIDYFRQLNEGEGRARGDRLLREFAELLRNTAASTDTVVRLGNDEFAVLVPQASDNGLRELAGRLTLAARAGMPAPFSLGWALRDDGEPIESTLRRADKMLLRSRAEGRA